MCTEAKGATAFELATVMLAVELEPKLGLAHVQKGNTHIT